MDAFFLDKVTWEYSQALYHAAAHLNREALIILRPATPYVCIGFHQDAEQEIDLDFAAQQNIPIFRREVGGGAVYLDSGQLFYQLILRSDRANMPGNISDFYRVFLAPIVETYRAFGVPAEYKPVNDIVANNRKVSGTGAAEIDGMLVLVGNFIMDFNYDMMSKVLRVPDEKFRDKVYKTLHENLSTFLRETGNIPNTAELAHDVIPRYESILEKMSLKTEPDPELLTTAERLIEEMNTSEWLFENDRRRPDVREVKIRDGVYVIQNMTKTPGGLIRVTAVNDDGYLRDVHISGDFFFFPAENLQELETVLNGASGDIDNITTIIVEFYRRNDVESPGVEPVDFARVLVSP